MAKISAKTKSERLKRLLAHGYFAPELPPCFVSDGLAKFRASILRGIAALPNKKTARPNYYDFVSEISSFYYPRFGKQDRRHGVPNPISHLLLSKVLADNYVDLRRKARNSNISISPPFFDWLGSRALMRPSIELLDNFRVNLSTRREEYVAADVRAFFHSIYTHAIPWAIHGKQFAKQNRSLTHYGNLIDLLCRNAQGGQTIGLPVGPDTSRLIAEVVASATDVYVQGQLKVGTHDASRYIDDYTLSSPNGASGEEMLAILRQAAAFFELELNSEKSSIHATSRRHSMGWQQATRAYLPRSPLPGVPVETSDLQHFLYQLGRVCLAHPDINVEKFGLQHARGAIVKVKDWGEIQSNLINAYRRNSSLIALLVELCLLRQAALEDVGGEQIKEFIESRIPVLARANRTGEIIWLLFLAIRLRLKIKASHMSALFSIENAFIALLVVYLDKNGLVRGNIDRHIWNKSLTSDGLRGQMWLYAYEGTTQRLIPGAKDIFIVKDPYFSLLKEKGVQFLNITRGYTSISTTLRDLRNENTRLQRMRDAIQEENFEEWDDPDDEADTGRVVDDAEIY